MTFKTKIQQLSPHHHSILRLLKQKPYWSISQLSTKLKIPPANIMEACQQLRHLGAKIILSKTAIDCQTDWINVTLITAHLPKHMAMPSCYLFNSIPSSNNTMLALAKTQKEHIALCLTEHQSHGRGRFKHHWASPLGCNLYFSLLYPYNKPYQTPELSEAIAHWVIEAIGRYGITEHFTVKAPNDVLHQGKKCAGILIESLCQAKQDLLVIGIGVNLNMTEHGMLPHINQPWNDLAAITGQAIDRNRFCAALLTTLLERLSESSP